jgi:hypothetical protein
MMSDIAVAAYLRDGRSQAMVSERASQQTFFGVSALVFAASAALTTAWCGSMSAMGEMPTLAVSPQRACIA